MFGESNMKKKIYLYTWWSKNIYKSTFTFLVAWRNQSFVFCFFERVIWLKSLAQILLSVRITFLQMKRNETDKYVGPLQKL